MSAADGGEIILGGEGALLLFPSRAMKARKDGVLLRPMNHEKSKAASYARAGKSRSAVGS